MRTKSKGLRLKPGEVVQDYGDAAWRKAKLKKGEAGE